MTNSTSCEAPTAAAEGAEVGLSPAALERIAAAVAEQEVTPGWIGRYRLIEVIGQGGMGEVWRAEQDKPIRRTVALKLIKLGMDTREVIARFEAERQTLALMNHPNVAKVLDAGASETGRPYFVMEFVPGEPITAFCDRHAYTIAQRLQLFMQACAAVGHAHQKGILHRDLKPGNILVTLESGGPQVKVIDFGIAKALEAHPGEQTLHTHAGQIIGTPEYMPPEQALSEGRDVDTRSDIYSLGVVLYELLCGLLPFDAKAMRGPDLAEVQRIIREVDPPRPGTRLVGAGDEQALSIATGRQAQLRDLARQLGRELEWIPLKALRKERSARYASISELAADIENYLSQRPLLAGPESRSYRLRKFARRNKGPLAVTAAFVALIIASTVLYVRGMRLEQKKTLAALNDAKHQRNMAEKRAEETMQVAEVQTLGGLDVHRMGSLLRDDILEEARQSWRRSNLSEEEIARRQAELETLLAGANFTNPAIRSLEINIYDRTLKMIEERFVDQPLVKAQLLQAVADALRNLTLLRRATAPQLEALEIRRRLLAPDDPARVASTGSMALLLAAKGRWKEAEPLQREVLERRRQTLGEKDPLMLKSWAVLAEIVQRQGRLGEAETLRRQVMDACVAVLGDNDPQSIDATLRLGQVLLWRYKYDEAEHYLNQAIEASGRYYGPDDLRTKRARGILGNLRRLQGRYKEAEDLFRLLYEANRAAAGDDDRDTLYSLLRLGNMLRLQGNLPEAERFITQSLEGFRRQLGDTHGDTLRALHEMGSLRQAQRDFPQAELYLRQALEGFRWDTGPDDDGTLDVMRDLGYLLEAQGKWLRAEQVYAELYDIAARGIIDDNPAARFMSFHGPCLVRLEKYELAKEPLLEAYRRLKQTGQEGHLRMRTVIYGLAEACEKTGAVDEAAFWRSELAALRATTQPTTAPVR